MPKQFEFQPDKALAVTAYLADQSGATMYTILKMVYLADRCHLERYGRPITGDFFIAMRQGACPSLIYDSMKYLRGEKNRKNHLPDAEKYLAVDPESFEVSVLDNPSVDVLSASDIECMDEILSILRRNGRKVIWKLAHDGAWEATAPNKEMDWLEIARNLGDGELVVRHLEDRFPGAA